jgi:hypothetical protein
MGKTYRNDSRNEKFKRKKQNQQKKNKFHGHKFQESEDDWKNPRWNDDQEQQ